MSAGVYELLHVVRKKCSYTHVFIYLHNGIWHFRQLTQRNWKLTNPSCSKVTIQQHSYVSTPAPSHLQHASYYISLQMNTTALFMCRFFMHLGANTAHTALALQLNVSAHFPLFRTRIYFPSRSAIWFSDRTRQPESSFQH
jgi:hypothetical protein